MAPKDNKKPLKQIAEEKLKNNPSAIGDPVSLKAETSDNESTDKDRPNKDSKVGQGQGEKKSLKEVAQEKLATNPSQLGDPISMKAETADSHPTDQDRGAAEVDPKKLHKPKL